MRNYYIYIIFVFVFGNFIIDSVNAQELNAKVAVHAQQLGTSADQSAVKNLQAQLTDFLNNKKWTKDVFLPQERISCNFSITLKSLVSQNIYDATLVVQAARPVLNSIYQSPLVNYRDDLFLFKYLPSQRLDVDVTRATGGDPLQTNLTSVITYWVNIILGMHYASFELKAGKPYFTMAQNIVNAAPQANNIKGWQLFDGERSRFALAYNLSNPRFEKIENVIYDYYRKGLDNFYTDNKSASSNALEVLRELRDIYTSNPSSMIIPFFIENRGTELLGIFKNSFPNIKSDAYQILILLDPGNIEKYHELQ